MIAQSTVEIQIQSHRQVGATHYVIAVPENTPSFVVLGITARNDRTGQEAYLDCIQPNGDFRTTLAIVKKILGAGWLPFESHVIEKSTVQPIAA